MGDPDGLPRSPSAPTLRLRAGQAREDDDPFGLVGQTLAGRFRIERRVAEGGFGVVYKAHQNALGRDVAVKVLKMPECLTFDQRHAFRCTFAAEALTIARLRQPAIVQVHDFGVAERAGRDALHWMALEWLEGETLEAMLQRQPGRPLWEPAAALSVLRPVFQAIGHAHRQRVVHRDLKPANVFLIPSAEGLTPKVLDFGIAKMMTVEVDLEGRRDPKTTSGFPAFSPDYAAPEQFSHGPTGPWTDVHALGLILTEVITGQLAYSTNDEVRLGEIMSESRPTPASKGVALGAWEPVLAKALALRPSQRFPDADSFLRALDEARPPPRRPPRRRGRAARFVTWAAIGAAVAAVALFLLVGPLVAPAPIRLAVLPVVAGDYLGDGLTGGLVGRLGRLAPERLAVISVERNRPAGALDVAYLLKGGVERRGDRVHVQARLVRARDAAEIWAQAYERDGGALLGLEDEIARAVAGALRIAIDPDQGSAPRSVDPRAYDAYLRGRFFSNLKTPEGLRQARDYFEQAIRLDPRFAAAHAGLAVNYPGWGDPAATEAKGAALRAVALDDRLAEAHAALASVLLAHDWDWPGAEYHYRRALALDPSSGETHGWYARVALSTGRFDEAIAERKRALELSPLSLDAHSAVGAALYMARRYDEAIAHLERTAELDRAAWLPHLFLGCLYAHRGQYDRALAEGERCGGYPLACLGRVTGYTLALAGRTGEALAVVDRMKELARTTYVSPLDVARVYAGLRRTDDAFAWLDRAAAERTRDLIFLRVDPQWDPLRHDRRFAALIRRVGIP